MTPLLLWMIALGALSGASCALAGCYLVLRRMSLLGDAISHAVLPGLVIAYLLTGRLSGWPMLAGALALGLMTAWLTAAVRDWAGVSEDAGMGVVFTTLFALGVVLLYRAGNADLDPGCVLYGLLELAADDTVPFLGAEVPRAVFTLAPVLLLVAGALVVAWKEVQTVSFDPALAVALGIPALAVHQVMLALVAVVVTASFEAVGSILVVAMLVVPPVTARMLTGRLDRMYLLSALIAAASAAVGVTLAAWWNTSAAGMMAVSAGAMMLLAWLFGPHGLVSQGWRAWALAVRIASEDLLARLYRTEQGTAAGPLPGGLAGWLARRVLRSRGELDGGRLTDAGRARAASLVRAHRLWEAYLHSELALPMDHLHEPAEVMEHFLDAAFQARLSEALAQPQADPHGKPIPGEPGASSPGEG
jgi:ABC-type Mn2+/Zn2+ transport system permease subunit